MGAATPPCPVRTIGPRNWWEQSPRQITAHSRHGSRHGCTARAHDTHAVYAHTPKLIDLVGQPEGCPASIVTLPPPNGLHQWGLGPAHRHVLELVIPMIFCNTPLVLLQCHLCNISAKCRNRAVRPEFHGRRRWHRWRRLWSMTRPCLLFPPSQFVRLRPFKFGVRCSECIADVVLAGVGRYVHGTARNAHAHQHDDACKHDAACPTLRTYRRIMRYTRPMTALSTFSPVFALVSCQCGYGSDVVFVNRSP